MDMGKDTFLWLRFVFELVKLFISVFGNDDDKDNAKKNGFAPGNDGPG